MKKLKLTAVVVLVLIGVSAFAACGKPATAIVLPERSLKVAADDSVAFAAPADWAAMGENIDRGFRPECYYTLGSGLAWPKTGGNGYEELDKTLEYYAADNCKEMQVYIYLCEYNEKPLDDLAFNQMKKFFEYFRSKRMAMLLRFAYEFDQADLQGPTHEMLLSHIGQLTRFMRANERLIRDTVTAYQFGCIGAWGEWGATANKYKEKEVLYALLDMMPSGIYFQGRYMRVVNQTAKHPRFEYVGYHNDFLLGRPHPWSTAGDIYTSKDYKTFAANAPYRINDGEMPWGGRTEEPNEYVDGKNFLVQCAEHCLSTFSIAHNYTEWGEKFNIERWKTDMLTAADLEARRLPYVPGWFEDETGNTIERSVFDYLRDYLGYCLAVSNLTVKDGEVRFVLTNYGMGTPLNLDAMYLVVGEGEDAREIYLNDFDTEKLTSWGQIEFRVKTDVAAGERLGVKIVRGCSTGDYLIRTANGLGFTDGVNVICAGA